MPNTLYVGQWFRQSPQWTQVESSSQLGASFAKLAGGCKSGSGMCGPETPDSNAVVPDNDSDNKSSPVQNIFRIDGPLHCAHHVHVCRRGPPNVKVWLGFLGAMR